VLVTGGRNGLGRAFAEHFLAKSKVSDIHEFLLASNPYVSVSSSPFLHLNATIWSNVTTQKVIIAGRTPSNLQQAASEVSNPRLHVMELDVGDVGSLATAFVSRLLEEHDDLDCLTNNAGIMELLDLLAGPRRRRYTRKGRLGGGCERARGRAPHGSPPAAAPQAAGHDHERFTALQIRDQCCYSGFIAGLAARAHPRAGLRRACSRGAACGAEVVAHSHLQTLLHAQAPETGRCYSICETSDRPVRAHGCRTLHDPETETANRCAKTLPWGVILNQRWSFHWNEARTRCRSRRWSAGAGTPPRFARRSPSHRLQYINHVKQYYPRGSSSHYILIYEENGKITSSSQLQRNDSMMYVRVDKNTRQHNKA
jgi:hypothetical protein